MDASSQIFSTALARGAHVTELQLADDKLPLLKMKSVDISKTASSPNDYRTITIDNDGSTGSKLIIFLNLGASSSDYSQYQFSAYATGVTDPSGVDSSPTHTQVTTLGALVVAINALAVGFKAYRLNGPADYSLDTNDFVDLTEADIGTLFAEYLYKDASEVLTVAARIGVPEEMDHGHIELLMVRAYCNSDSATDCVFKISRDPSENDATEEVNLGLERYLPDITWTDLVDLKQTPTVHEGPLLVELTSTTTMTETTTRAFVIWRSAEY